MSSPTFFVTVRAIRGPVVDLLCTTSTAIGPNDFATTRSFALLAITDGMTDTAPLPALLRDIDGDLTHASFHRDYVSQFVAATELRERRNLLVDETRDRTAEDEELPRHEFLLRVTMTDARWLAGLKVGAGHETTAFDVWGDDPERPTKAQIAKVTKAASRVGDKPATAPARTSKPGAIVTVPMKGGLQLAAAGPGGRVALVAYEQHGIVHVIDGGTRTKIRLENRSSMFPQQEEQYWSQQWLALSFVVRAGEVALAAVWQDDGKDGGGFGLFALTGAPLALVYFLPLAVRKARAKTGQASTSGPPPSAICVSPDRTSVAVRISEHEVRVWRLDAVTDKDGTALDVGPSVGLGYDGTSVFVFSDKGLVVTDVARGKRRVVPAPAMGPIGSWSRADACGEVFVLRDGVVVDRAGKVRWRFPGNVSTAAAAGRAIAAIGGESGQRRLWFCDAVTGETLAEVPAPDAFRALAAADGNVVYGGRKTAVIAPWPGSISTTA